MEKKSEEKDLEKTVASKEMAEQTASDTPAEEIEDKGDIKTDTESDLDSYSDSSDLDPDSDYECEVCNKSISGYLSFRQHLKGKKHAKAVLRKKKEKKLTKIGTVVESDEELALEEPFAECKVCKKDFYGPEAYEQHLKSKKHKQKVLVASIKEQVQEDGKINADKLRDLCKKGKRTTDDVLEDARQKRMPLALEEDDEKDEEEYECRECEKLFSGLIPYTQHLTSKSHAKKVENQSLLHKIFPDTSKENEASQNDVTALCIEDDVIVCKICSTSFSGPENAMIHMKSKKHAKVLDKYVRKLEKRKEKKKLNDSAKKVEVKSEKEDEITGEKLQATSDGSGPFDIPDNTENSTASTSSNDKDNGTLLSYEKYKEYKKVMQSLREDEIIQ